jgi:hypothetical protein
LVRKITSENRITKLFKEFRIEKINDIITTLESSPKKYIEIDDHKLHSKQALSIAKEVKGAFHREQLEPHKHRDFQPITEKANLVDLSSLNIVRASPMPGPIPWNYTTANQLVSTCPFQSEIKQIRKDFNIYFEKELIDHGVLTPWSCTTNGKESSIMLSMYNIFRLLKCIPFDKNFPWATTYHNLYDWIKSLNLTAIGFFWAKQNQNSYASGNRVYLIGNILADPMYREIINPQSGVGIIHYMILLVHEATHAGHNINHNCGGGTKDTNLAYMGAWAVQYYLLKMLAENTDNFFTDYQKNSFLWDAQNLLKTRFCNQPP